MHFNSQPREGGWSPILFMWVVLRYFNSQPREGGWFDDRLTQAYQRDFNSQPREGGWRAPQKLLPRVSLFQLTAARRRLENWLS